MIPRLLEPSLYKETEKEVSLWGIATSVSSTTFTDVLWQICKLERYVHICHRNDKWRFGTHSVPVCVPRLIPQLRHVGVAPSRRWSCCSPCLLVREDCEDFLRGSRTEWMPRDGFNSAISRSAASRLSATLRAALKSWSSSECGCCEDRRQGGREGLTEISPNSQVAASRLRLTANSDTLSRVLFACNCEIGIVPQWQVSL